MTTHHKLIVLALLMVSGALLIQTWSESGPAERVALEPMARMNNVHAEQADLQAPARRPAVDVIETRNKASVPPQETSSESAGAFPPDGKRVQGWVLDPFGRPVTNARVTPWRRAGRTKSLDRSHTQVTDDAGRFLVYADPRGAAQLVVEHPDFLLWNGSLADEQPVSIELQAPAMLRARVLNASGQPALGSTIQYDTQELHPARRALAVDERGRFEIAGLEPGNIRLWVSGPHGSVGPLEVLVGDEEQQVITLGAVRSLSVRVEDASSLPLADARVVLMPEGERRTLAAARSDERGHVHFAAAPAGPLRVTAEHERGLFEPLAVEQDETVLRSLPCGSLVLTHAGASALLVKLSRGAGEDLETLQLIARPGRELRCTPLAAGLWTASWSLIAAQGALSRGIDPRAASRSAEFRVNAGEPTHGELTLPPAASIRGTLAWTCDAVCNVELRSAAQGALVTSAEVSRDGSFQLDGLPAGAYVLILQAEGGGQWRDPRVLALDAGQALEVALSPAGTIADLHVQTEQGRPLPGASARLQVEPSSTALGSSFNGRVHIAGTTGLPAAGANESGRIRLELLAPGPQVAVVRAPGYHPLEVTIEAGQPGVKVTLLRL